MEKVIRVNTREATVKIEEILNVNFSESRDKFHVFSIVIIYYTLSINGWL